MNSENQVIAVEKRLSDLLTELPGYFLVEISVKPTNNIKVFVDADQGAAIDQLSRINRALYKWIEENLFPNGDFSLEVSSPGLDEPLKLNRQYLKNIGRKVAATLLDGTEKEGTLLAATEEKITIEETVGKKKEKVTTDINLSEIKHTMVCIVF